MFLPIVFMIFLTLIVEILVLLMRKSAKTANTSDVNHFTTCGRELYSPFLR